jgi:hypothetical protein
VLAQLSQQRLRAKLTELEEAFTGHFSDHHAFLLTRMLNRIEAIDAHIAPLDARIGEEIAQLSGIPDINPVSARVIIAEIGLDMTRFPTAAHLASWAKFASRVKEFAGKKEGRGTRPPTRGRRRPPRPLSRARYQSHSCVSSGISRITLGLQVQAPLSATPMQGCRQGRLCFIAAESTTGAHQRARLPLPQKLLSQRQTTQPGSDVVHTFASCFSPPRCSVLAPRLSAPEGGCTRIYDAVRIAPNPPSRAGLSYNVRQFLTKEDRWDDCAAPPSHRGH